MDEFVKRCLLFLIFCILITSGTYQINQYLFRHDPFLVPDSISVVITGDSYANAAIDPSIVKNSVNVSQSQEPFLLQYQKIRFIHKSNSGRVNTFILTVSPTYLSFVFDRVLVDGCSALEMYSRSYPYVDIECLDGFRFNKIKYLE